MRMFLSGFITENEVLEYWSDGLLERLEDCVRVGGIGD